MSARTGGKRPAIQRRAARIHQPAPTGGERGVGDGKPLRVCRRARARRRCRRRRRHGGANRHSHKQQEEGKTGESSRPNVAPFNTKARAQKPEVWAEMVATGCRVVPWIRPKILPPPRFTVTPRGARGAVRRAWVMNAIRAKHEVSAPPADGTLKVSADPAFRGDPSRMNPEQLLLMSAASCQLLTFLAVAARAAVGRGGLRGRGHSGNARGRKAGADRVDPAASRAS